MFRLSFQLLVQVKMRYVTVPTDVCVFKSVNISIAISIIVYLIYLITSPILLIAPPILIIVLRIL